MPSLYTSTTNELQQRYNLNRTEAEHAKSIVGENEVVDRPQPARSVPAWRIARRRTGSWRRRSKSQRDATRRRTKSISLDWRAADHQRSRHVYDHHRIADPSRGEARNGRSIARLRADGRTDGGRRKAAG